MKALVSLAAFCVVVASMKAAANIVNPLLMGMLITMVAWPPMRWLQARKVPESISLLLIGLSTLVVGTIFGSIFASAIGGFREKMPLYDANFRTALASGGRWLSDLGIDLDVATIENAVDPAMVFGQVADIANGIGAMVANFTVVVLVSTFLLLELDALPERVRSLHKHGGVWADRINEVTARVNRYLALKTWLSALTGVVAGLGLAAIGVNHAVLWGTLAFMLNYVPNIGSVLAAIPPTLLAAIQLGPAHVVWVMILFTVVNMVIGNILEPALVGNKMGLSSFVVIVSLLFWGWVLGPVGMFLSVPLTMILKIGLDESEGYRWAGALLGDSSSTSGK